MEQRWLLDVQSAPALPHVPPPDEELDVLPLDEPLDEPLEVPPEEPLDDPLDVPPLLEELLEPPPT